MTEQNPAPIREADYTAIEAAVMETQRGRWFLAEYARRNRSADTEQVLGAIDRIDKSIKSAQPEKLAVLDDMLASIVDMADAIARTKREIVSLSSEGESDHFGDASVELDAVVDATEGATNSILSAAEKIQEYAFAAMERGEAGSEMESIDAAVMEIYEGCSFQDITGQRISKVVQTLRYLEDRINAMAAAWNLADAAQQDEPETQAKTEPAAHTSDPLLNGPAKPGEAMLQDEVDTLLDDSIEASAESTIDGISDKRQNNVDTIGHERRVPALASNSAAIDAREAVEAMPQLSAAEIDALYS